MSVQAYINNNWITRNMSTLQKKDNEIDIIVLIASTVLIYFISYFFVFIDKNPMKIITIDYTTTLISLIPPTAFLAAIFIFTRVKNAIR